MNIDKMKFLRTTGIAILTLRAACAQAHPGHGTLEFAAGLAHPFGGLDHLLAMVAVGIWSAAVLPAGRRAIGPAVFLSALLAGALAAAAGLQVPGVEVAIAGSVAVLGAMLALGRRTGLVPGLLLLAAAAVLHGLAHGSEMISGQTFAAYAGGFMLGSAALHGAGLAAGAALTRLPAWTGRALASLMAASGLLMLATRV
jgi:urease accessory protein